MEDKKGVVLYDEKGCAYLKIIREKTVIQEKVEEFKEDLEDDGKRNFSNNDKKKSPGRKKRTKKVW